MIRIGQGFDVHAFADAQAGASIQLGGIAVPAHAPLLAHSDGDVLLHAVCDALLGAMALGDIGDWFPDTDSTWLNVDSRLLLTRVYQEVQASSYQLSNLDVTLMAQTPKVAPHKKDIQRSLAQLLAVSDNQINIKATTTEQLGFLGRSEGVACAAICLLVPQ